MKKLISYAVTTTEMKQYDKNMTEHFHMQSEVLMERAAMAVFLEIQRVVSGIKNPKILVVSGTGNNGGDGVAIARILFEHGISVDLVLPREKEHFSVELKKQLVITEKMGIPIAHEIGPSEYAVIVDAIFGIGLSRKIEDRKTANTQFAKVIEQMNEMEGYKISVDMPSGIHTDTGEIMAHAVKADCTITFAFRKMGQMLFPGKQYCGKVIVSRIGITEAAFMGQEPKHFYYDMPFFDKSVRSYLPVRALDGNKGTFGKVLMITGSNQMTGAAVLSAKAAFYMGCGMVKIITESTTAEVIRKSLPEAMVTVTEEEEMFREAVREAVFWADDIVIGPGIGTDSLAKRKLELLFEQLQVQSKPVVIDADAINLIAADEELKKQVLSYKYVILTPHMGELSRLLKKPVQEIKENFEDNMAKMRANYPDAVFVCKDAVTRVVSGAKKEYINLCGNNKMATAGMGDILSGIIGTLGCQMEDVFEAVTVAVYIHSLAGDEAAKKSGTGMLSGDVIGQLNAILSNPEDREYA